MKSAWVWGMGSAGVSLYLLCAIQLIRSCWVVQTVSLGLHLFTETTVLKCHRDIVVSIFFLLTAAEFLCHLFLFKDLYSLTESTHPAPVFVQPFLQRDVTGWWEELVCVSAAERRSGCRRSRGDHEWHCYPQQCSRLMIFLFFGTVFQNTMLLLLCYPILAEYHKN